MFPFVKANKVIFLVVAHFATVAQSVRGGNFGRFSCYLKKFLKQEVIFAFRLRFLGHSDNGNHLVIVKSTFSSS